MISTVLSRRRMLRIGTGAAAMLLTGVRAADATATVHGSPAMKMIVLFRRKATLTPDEFRDYYETKHAPMAMQLFPYLRDYRRNYVRHDLQHTRAAPPDGQPAPMQYDVITEFSFASEADYRRMVSDMAVPDIRDRVVADEKRFLDRSATVVFLVDEQASPP